MWYKIEMENINLTEFKLLTFIACFVFLLIDPISIYAIDDIPNNQILSNKFREELLESNTENLENIKKKI